MQRAITATPCLSRADAIAALPGVRKNLKYRGLTQDPFPMCATVRKWGAGWAVFVGFQKSVDLNAVPEEFQERVTSEFSALTHSM